MKIKIKNIKWKFIKLITIINILVNQGIIIWNLKARNK
jgi:hypothetical protein